MVSSLIQDSVIQEGSGETSAQDLSLLHHVARQFNALCLDESWVWKKASSTPQLQCDQTHFESSRVWGQVDYNNDRDGGRSHSDVIIRVSNINTLAQTSEPSTAKLTHLLCIFLTELSSSNAVVGRRVRLHCTPF